MSDPPTPAGEGGSTTNAADGPTPVEAYETTDATVLFDADNPLAWIESSETLDVSDLV